MASNKWFDYLPSWPGRYRVHDTVFGHKFYVRVFKNHNGLLVKPEDEEDAQAILVRATPTWWRWKHL